MGCRYVLGTLYNMNHIITLDDFFERTHGSYMGRVEKIDINRIENFKNHPFKVKDDEQMENLVESIKENGVLNPIIVRPTK